MSKTIKNRMHREIEALLKDSGLCWRIDLGKKHRKVFIEDKMVGVFSNCKSHTDIGPVSNILNIIRRHLKSKGIVRP